MNTTSEILKKAYKISQVGFADNTGSVRIPKRVMDSLDVEPGDYILYEITADGVKIHKARVSVMA